MSVLVEKEQRVERADREADKNDGQVTVVSFYCLFV